MVSCFATADTGWRLLSTTPLDASSWAASNSPSRPRSWSRPSAATRKFVEGC